VSRTGSAGSEPEIPFEREGQYTLLEELGRGGQSVVIRTFDEFITREVALKELPISRARRSRTMEPPEERSEIERREAAHGKADGVGPATDGKSSASKFKGPHSRPVIDGAGHNLPEEAPKEFAEAAWELASETG
jgi:hypothetical protein